MNRNTPSGLLRIFLCISFLLGLTINMMAGENVTNIPGGQRFFIKSALSGTENSGFWDQSGRPPQYKKGQDIKVWSKDRSYNVDQQFQFVSLGRGWYNIKSANGGGYLDVRNGVNANGVQLQLWEQNHSISQRFRIQHEGSGRFKIYTYWGRIVCLPHRKDNGTPVHTWNNMRGAWMQWRLIDAETNQPWNPAIPPRRTQEKRTPSSSSSETVYTLQEGEEFVLGRTGLNDEGRVKYTLAVIRKANPGKTFYKAGFDPYGPRGLGERTMRAVTSPGEENLYDFWLIFNGKKMGPYDRILDMTQDNPDVDDWISDDGQGISFSGAREDMYGSVINNRRGYSFWTTNQAPLYDGASGSQDYIIQFGPNDFRYIEKGRTKFRGWKKVRDFAASHDGEATLYTGSETNSRELNVYLNHELIDGPVGGTMNVGFVPGTQTPYYTAYFHGQETPSYSVVGSQKITAPLNGSFEKTVVSPKALLFTVKVKDSNIPGVNSQFQYRFDYYYYNNQSGTLKKWPTQGAQTSRAVVQNGDIYVRTVSSDGEDILFLNPQGGVSQRIPTEGTNAIKAAGSSRLAADSQGNLFTAIKLDETDTYRGNYSVYKNGERIYQALEGFSFKRFETMPNTGKLFAVFRHENSTQDFNYTVFYGSTQFQVTGRVRDWIPAPEAEVVFSLRQDRPDGPVQILKNGTLIDNTWWKGACEFTPSADGTSYAMMDVTDNSSGLPYYRIDNSTMHRSWQIFFNSKPYTGGKSGAPQWNPETQQFVFLEQQGRNIRVNSFSP